MATLLPGEKARMYALGAVARGGATRGGYVSSAVYFSFDGVPLAPAAGQPHVGVLLGSLTITDVLDETPNTCTFQTNAFVPAAGSEVKVMLGSKNASPLFAGFALDVQQRYVGQRPANIQADVSAVDYTWFLGFLKVTKQYRSLSATAIAQDLVATFAGMNGFTTKNVAINLPYLDEITYTDEDVPNALTRLCRRIGAYWYVDYSKDVHLFFEETLNGAPVDLTPSHPSLANFTHGRDRSQALTRVYVEGRGSRLLSHVNIGDTMLPLDTVVMFDPPAADVFLKAAFQGSEGGATHLNYSGVQQGGAGAIVGPGVTPSSAPVAVAQTGGSVNLGSHDYAYTWVTASGETKPSPIATLTHVSRPADNPTQWLQGSGGAVFDSGILVPGGIYRTSYVWATHDADPPTQLTLAATASNPWTSNANGAGFAAGAYSADPFVTSIWLYRTQAGGTTLYRYPVRFVNYPAQAGSTFMNRIDAVSDAAIVAYGAAPTSNTTAITTGQTALSGIAIGPAAVTARKVYRSAANTTQLKLLTTLANNTATTHQDTAADATLGANAPTSDTAALPQPAGQVNAGDPAIIVTSTTAFLAGGGWAVIGNGEQVVRYTGVSGNAITGIPATPPGAITATIAYGSNITAAAMLTGIPSSGARSISRALTAGDEIYLVVQVDDTTAQSGMADMVNIGPGIREEWVQDRRLSIPEARARGQATLKIRPLEQTRCSYTCRDLRTASGKTITVNLPAPTNVTGTFKIQSVTIGNFRPYPTQYPTFTVEASSQRFSFDDWLRLLKVQE